MAYRIEYDPEGIKRSKVKQVGKGSALTTILLTIVLVVGAVGIKVSALPWIEHYLIPADPAVTAAALEELAADLREGEPIADAVSTFCQQILENG